MKKLKTNYCFQVCLKIEKECAVCHVTSKQKLFQHVLNALLNKQLRVLTETHFDKINTLKIWVQKQKKLCHNAPKHFRLV